MIYFVRCEKDNAVADSGWIKIGTTVRLSARLREIAVMIDHAPTVLGVMDGSFAEESAIHAKFGHARKDGEWFVPHESLLKFLADELRPWDGTDESRTLSVKLRMGVIESARVVAALRGVTITDLISDMIEDDLKKMEHEEIDKRAKASKKGAK